MVKTAGKKTNLGPLRALNLPVRIEVEEDAANRPVSVVTRGKRIEVVSIEDVWEIVDEWWRTTPVARRYYRIVLEDGSGLTIFCDLLNGLWHYQRA